MVIGGVSFLVEVLRHREGADDEAENDAGLSKEDCSEGHAEQDPSIRGEQKKGDNLFHKLLPTIAS